FVAIPSSVTFRPERNTPKPVVEGVQTAIVAGPSGEEIYTDEHGRVKVQFHWDRQGKYDEKSSCWIRVSQNWAGKNWGMFFLPRIGHEVIVDFMEGDPDRPIITGRVHNAEAVPPYELPTERTKSTIKSLSSPDGDGFNEIRFEDKKGEEDIFIHAEKNQDIRVKNDLREWIGNDSHLIVYNDKLEQVEVNKHLTVKGDHNEKVDGTISIEAGRDMQEKVGQKHALDAGQEIHLKAGMKVIIEAGTQVSLKAGGNFVDIGPGGVTIQGTMVKINSGGSAGSGSGCSPESPQEPQEAGVAETGEKVYLTPFPPSNTPQAQALQQASQSGKPLCEN
ncbi:MAG: type VI secretion system tip protein VgrG, partial [Deltaproteobacteria bacterium]|nr:type VI secretion system tip protein VgrG [Deltaproteobacteria bacterium]